jgi:beta-phosphoglucomutase family hydrolase
MPARTFQAVIFDIDGVVVETPHEQAWREAIAGFADPRHFTTAFYQQNVAGKPRMDGALAALRALGVPNAETAVHAYAERKQQLIDQLIAKRAFAVFPDAMHLLEALKAHGIRVAAASSSKNANPMLQLIPFASATLYDAFDANLCGRDFPHGKPAPDIFLAAANELRASPAQCVVVEDAPAGIAAARAGGMASIGIARLDDSALLHAAHADLVVTSLDQVSVDALMAGRLEEQPHPQ